MSDQAEEAKYRQPDYGNEPNRCAVRFGQGSRCKHSVDHERHESESGWSWYAHRPQEANEAINRLLAQNKLLREALEMVLVYHSGGPWTATKARRWERWTGGDFVSTHDLCSQIRVDLARATEPEGVTLPRRCGFSVMQTIRCVRTTGHSGICSEVEEENANR